MRDAAEDVLKITLHLTNKSVKSEIPDRRAPQFVHPTKEGWEKMNNPDWLASSSLVEEEVRRGESEMEYELSVVYSFPCSWDLLQFVVRVVMYPAIQNNFYIVQYHTDDLV